MNKLDQRRIVNNIVLHIEQTVKNAIRDNKIPKEWDGLEIAQYIADIAAANAPDWGKYDNQKRYKDYLNHVITKGL